MRVRVIVYIGKPFEVSIDKIMVFLVVKLKFHHSTLL